MRRCCGRFGLAGRPAPPSIRSATRSSRSATRSRRRGVARPAPPSMRSAVRSRRFAIRSRRARTRSLTRSTGRSPRRVRGAWRTPAAARSRRSSTPPSGTNRLRPRGVVARRAERSAARRTRRSRRSSPVSARRRPRPSRRWPMRRDTVQPQLRPNRSVYRPAYRVRGGQRNPPSGPRSGSQIARARLTSNSTDAKSDSA